MNTASMLQSAKQQGPDDQDSPDYPKTLGALGLPLAFMVEHFVKVLFVHDQATLQDLAGLLRVPSSLVLELAMEGRSRKLLQISTSGNSQGDAHFQLSEGGVLRAEQALNRCQYSGPLPVPLEAYVNQLRKQAAKPGEFFQSTVRKLFQGVVIEPVVIDTLGAAMNSGRATLLYGPAGSGKTFVVQCLANILRGSIYVPHAIYVAGDIVLIFDPLVHVSADDKSVFSAVTSGTPMRLEPSQVKSLFVRRDDERWVKCKRPFVVVGGELTLAALDLQFDPSRRFYQATPQIKANGGMLLIDDLGRQMVSPRELMNRWIVPLDRHCDYLTLNSGYRFEMPFDLSLIFSTNLSPSELADEAFLRRFGYKILLGELSAERYAQLFKDECAAFGVEYLEEAFSWLVNERHQRFGKPLLACYPRDLLGRVHDQALYEKRNPIADITSLNIAWDTYFVRDADANSVFDGQRSR